MENKVSVILNGYNRPENLAEQLESIRNQTVTPHEIMIWLNKTEGFDETLLNDITTVKSNRNFGVWARFAFALNATSEYVCIFDDDTIPGKKWLENCLQTMETHEGLLGTRGLKYRDDSSYHFHEVYGWDFPKDDVVQVDIVGHSWFFKREWLWSLWRETPPKGKNFDIIGEDMFFSYSLKKYLDINTYVPPHPINDREMWGSTKGWQYGTIKATSDHSVGLMQQFYLELIARGWKILNDEKKNNPNDLNFEPTDSKYKVPVDVKNGVCVDVGSGNGEFTKKYKNFFSKILFIEPNKGLFNQSVSELNEYLNIEGLNKAVWSSDNELVSLVNHMNGDSGSAGIKEGSVDYGWNGDLINTIETITIDTIYTLLGNIDFLKVDCENSEFEFLYEKDLSKVQFLNLEIHNQMGEEKYFKLIDWINKSHNLIHGEETYSNHEHKMLLYKLR